MPTPQSPPPPPITAPSDVAAPGRDARKTASGLAMKVLVRGSGKTHPHRNDCVRLRYLAWTPKGEAAGRSVDDPAGELACLRGMKPGMVEAVTAMVPGEQRRLWIPEALAFPRDPDEDDQPARTSDLTYDLSLLTIIAAPPAPRSLKAPPARAKKLPSGVAILISKKGHGHQHPSGPQRMTLHVSGWKADGTLFETTRMENHPLDTRLTDLVPGLGQAVETLVVGDVAQVWVPAALAYEGPHRRRGQPAGNLVYQVELVELVALN